LSSFSNSDSVFSRVPAPPHRSTMALAYYMLPWSCALEAVSSLFLSSLGVVANFWSCSSLACLMDPDLSSFFHISIISSLCCRNWNWYLFSYLDPICLESLLSFHRLGRYR
jgi:hypothetical protein